MRFTLSDLANRVNELGYTTKEDWFPLSCTTPITELIQALRNEDNVMVSCHPLCGIGTYLFVDRNKKPTAAFSTPAFQLLVKRDPGLQLIMICFPVLIFLTLFFYIGEKVLAKPKFQD